jgi:hypothetical protein
MRQTREKIIPNEELPKTKLRKAHRYESFGTGFKPSHDGGTLAIVDKCHSEVLASFAKQRVLQAAIAKQETKPKS